MFSGRLWNIFIDSFPKMLLRALTGTIPLTVIAFALAMVIAVVYCIFWIVKDWNFTRSISCGSNCIFIK